MPYDVVNTDEARALAEGNPLSFLRVSRAELELDPGTDPCDEQVYERAARNFEALRKTTLVVDDEPSVYVYRLRMGDRVQTGVAACVSLDEYDRDIIRKHERTRPDKENDRIAAHARARRADRPRVPDLSRLLPPSTASCSG